MGSLKTLPGVIDTSRARRPGLGLGRRHDDQRPDLVQLLLRRRHQQGHRLELGQLCRAGARLHRRSEGAGVELPGRVRPQLGRDDHGRHQERHARLSRHGRVLQAQREVQHQLLGSPPPVRRGPGRELRQGALPVRQHGVDDRRSGSGSRHRLQQEPRQAVLLLLAGPPAAQRSRHAAAEHDADGARARGRLLADVRQPGPAASSSRIRRSRRRGWRATSTPAAPAASRATRFRRTASARSGSRCWACSRCRTRPIRPAAASTTTPTRTSSRSRATTRWRASTTTSRTTPRSTRACSSATR